MRKIRTKNALLFPIIGLAFTFLFVQSINQNTIDTKAYDSQTITDITTINLNDCTDNEIKNYYSSLTSKSESEKKGNNLLKNLKTILKDGQKYFKYDGGNLWDLYEISDRDWSKSPASAISGYNPSTNIITGYKYNTNDPYVHSLYTKRSVDNQAKAHSDHTQSGWGINQEHIWPKSQGFNAKGAGGARGDPMHLWAGNGAVNNMHSNYMYGYVDLTNEYDEKSENYLKGNYLGISLTTGETGSSHKVFEPQDSDKGDIARAVFYMVARYNYLANDGDTIDQNNPNLELKQSTLMQVSYTSSRTLVGYMGLMSDLLHWNHIDPPDSYEIHRNNILYRNYTKNRNPFIDYPEWADYIWGSVVYNGRTYGSYNPNPTGYVDLTTDIINGFKNSDGISISKSSIELSINDSTTISATSTNGSNISWSTSNDEVASISTSSSSSGTNITVRGVSEGNAVLTASANINGKTYSKTCDVIVSGDQPEPTEEGWYLVKDTSKLVSNNKYVIASSTNGATAGDIVQSTTYLTKIDSTFSEDSTSITSLGNGSVEFTLGGSSGSWTLSYNNKLLGTSNAKSLKWNEGTTTWNISFDGNNAVISSTDERFGSIQYNSSSPRFLNYTSNQSPVQLYRYYPGAPKHVTGVELNKSSTELPNGTTETLVASVLPSDAADKSVTWSSSNPFVVTVDENGVITGVNEGTSIVTVTTNDGGFTDSCLVNVIEDTIISIEIDKSSSKLSYFVNEQFERKNIVGRVNYAHASSKVIPNSELTITANVGDPLSLIDNGKSITIEYTHLSKTFRASEQISVMECSGAVYSFSSSSQISSFNAPQGSSASYNSTSGVQLTAGNHMTINLNGYQNNRVRGISLLMKSNKATGSGYLSVKINDTTIVSIGSAASPLTFDDDLFNGEYSEYYHYLDLNLENEYLINQNESIVISINATVNSLYCKGVNVRYVSSEAPTIESISLSGNYQTTFFVGETFNHNNMVVTANLSDQTTQDVTSDSSWSNPDTSSIGNKTVIVTYLEFFTTYEINVVAQTKYTKVTSEPTSWEGTYLLVYETSETSGLTWTGVDAGKCHSDVTILNDVICNKPENAVTLTISPMTNGYSIRLNGGVNDGKYIGRAGYSNGIDISENECLNTISLGEGGVDIVGEGTIDGKCKLRYNKTSGDNNERFRYYKSGQEAIQLYKLTADIDEDLLAAENYSTKLDTCIVCYSGSQTPTIDGSTWPALASEFNQLSNESKNYLIDATYVVVGNTVTPLGETTQKIANGMAKYDQLVSRYKSIYSNFMNRDLPSGKVNYYVASFNNANILITSILSIISISALVCYLYYRVEKRH